MHFNEHKVTSFINEDAEGSVVYIALGNDFLDRFKSIHYINCVRHCRQAEAEGQHTVRDDEH